MLQARSIFISYRRADSQDVVSPIYERLVAEFGDDAVFMDCHSIPLGQDYRQVLKQQFSQCRVQLAVIGPDWVSVTDDDGTRRLDNPTDWVRLEIEAALGREEAIPVIPLLVKEAQMPRASELPKTLQDLTYRQKADIRPGRDFSKDLDWLVHWLRKHLEDQAQQEAISSLWIHGWVTYPYLNTPQTVLDWTTYFNMKEMPRRIATQQTWEQTLLPQLKQEADKIAPSAVVDVRGKLPLTAGLAIGTAFPTTLGYVLQTEQPTDGRNSIWRSDADPQRSNMAFEISQKKGNPGKNLLIALAISGRGWEDALKLFEDKTYDFDAVVCVEPTGGPSERSIPSDADAVSLAINAKELIRTCRSEYQATTIHLLPYGPLGFFLFLGQRLRVLGDIVTYEWVGQGYQHSVVLKTDQV